MPVFCAEWLHHSMLLDRRGGGFQTEGSVTLDTIHSFIHSFTLDLIVPRIL
jgi:hypothetical protein